MFYQILSLILFAPAIWAGYRSKKQAATLFETGLSGSLTFFIQITISNIPVYLISYFGYLLNGAIISRLIEAFLIDLMVLFWGLPGIIGVIVLAGILAIIAASLTKPISTKKPGKK